MWVLNASVPGLCILFTFTKDIYRDKFDLSGSFQKEDGNRYNTICKPTNVVLFLIKG